MISNLSSIFVKHDIIEEDDTEIYDYGVFVIVFNLLSISAIILLGVLFKRTVFTLLFLLFYLPNRMIIGGYHCKKPTSCFLTFTSSYSIILILSYILPFNNAMYTMGIILYLLLLRSYFKSSQSFYKSLIVILAASLLITYFYSDARESFVYANMLNFILYYISKYFVSK